MYDVYVHRKGKGVDFVQGRLKSEGTIADLERKYEKIGWEMILEESENRVDYCKIIEVVDIDEIPSGAPLARTHHFKYHDDFLKEFEISS